MNTLSRAELPEGAIFHGHYQIVRSVNAGAMGAVYEVVDLKTRRRRALKVMLPSIIQNAEMRERFKLEATITADIVSEHLVETFDAGVDPDTGAPFLTMELLQGDDLATLLQERRRFAPAEIVALLFQVARALDKTHAAGIVHRDLKPENLFVTHRDDGSPRVKVLDFGIAKIVAQSEAADRQTRNLGTPPYMSPEQITGDGTIGPRSDLYALGHIAYALLVGQPYWGEEAKTCETVYSFLMTMMQGAKEPPTQRAKRYGVTLPEAFDAWFARATDIVPAVRFESASEQIAALAASLGVALPAPAPSEVLRSPALVAAPGIPTGPASDKQTSKAPWMAIVVAFVALLLGASLVVLVARRPAQEETKTANAAPAASANVAPPERPPSPQAPLTTPEAVTAAVTATASALPTPPAASAPASPRGKAPSHSAPSKPASKSSLYDQLKTL
ncbi:serine/threonine protein kinase [Polyangium sorediatum]|uniref:Serine/threonine-protein kinase n=1 Tax=Polyangium sorediatum TaxID=889274 RepID=A0ABT6NXI1_9BACT|nr:serine/threonine-protein kinase [Polyangium sorediatum]MDI1433060.1 serine/threonine-protein kinase [Polyangium sorediatum]